MLQLLLLGTLTAYASSSNPVESNVPPKATDEIFIGPDHNEVDLIRVIEGGSRIYVQALLPDGELGLFMIDTGAAVSALNRETAERLGLDIDENFGSVEGLGGKAPFDRAVIPSIKIGDAEIPEVEVAVGVRGVADRAGMMPLDGILGNNVWSRFTVEIDYPADVMVLHRPGTLKHPRRKWGPMFFDGNHVYTPLVVTTEADPPHTDEIIIQVDTGASELLLSGVNGLPFEEDYTEGEEPIYGIGASEYMPPSMAIQRTRRIPVDSIVIGGRTVDLDLEARWINFEGGGRWVGPAGMQGLAGHELMQGHVAIFAYQDGWFALKKSRRKKRKINGHQVLLDQDLARHGDDKSRYLHRAQLYAWLDQTEKSKELLDAYLADHPDDAESRVMLAQIRRMEGDLDGAWDALTPLGAGELVDENEIVAAVNGALLEGRHEDALGLAEAAIAARPEEGWAYVSQADVLLAMGDLDGANRALLDAARLEQNPDAHLLRRARVALAGGDRYGSMSKIRKLLQLYPSGGPFLWFYAMLAKDSPEATTFMEDMQVAMARLHPNQRPLDFMVAAHQAIGEHDVAVELMHQGIDRDCAQSDDASKDNCVAWYYALAGHQKADALRRIERALEKEGDRSDFLDTKAMVHLSRGELDQAYAAAIAAARMSPDDVYMLWQAERIGAMAESAKTE